METPASRSGNRTVETAAHADLVMPVGHRPKATADERAQLTSLLKKPTPKPSAKKSTARKPTQKVRPAPVRRVGDRLINCAALGYGPEKQTRN